MLTNDRNTPEAKGDYTVLPVAADTKIFAGSLVAVDAAGNAVPGSNTDGLKGVGRAEEFVDNTGGAAGDVTVKIKFGVFKFDNDDTLPVTAAELLDNCYIHDDGTVRAFDTTPDAPNPIAGKAMQIDSDGVWVKF